MTIMHRSFYESWHGEKLPKDVVGWIKDHPFDDWKPVLYQDVVKRKIEKQNANIRFKKWDPYAVKRKPCFIWVFYNKGFPYGGWWLYIKTLKRDYPINFRQSNNKLICKIMDLYPCGMLPFAEHFDAWAVAFARQYHRPAFGRTKQGLVKAWCKIQKDKIIDIVPL